MLNQTNRMRNLLNNFILIVRLAMLFLIGSFYGLYKLNSKSNKNISYEKPIAICGNASLTETETLGKGIFNAHCAACHKLNANAIGPALAEIDSVIFNKWMNEDIIIKIETFDHQMEEFNHKKLSEHLNHEELEVLLLYIKKNLGNIPRLSN